MLRTQEITPQYFPLEEIAKILSDAPQVGNFKQTVIKTNGERVTYSFSWAVGTGSLHYKAQYRQHFRRETPAWVLFEHPFHQFRLCKNSVLADLSLPNSCSELPRGEA